MIHITVNFTVKVTTLFLLCNIDWQYILKVLVTQLYSMHGSLFVVIIGGYPCSCLIHSPCSQER